MTLRPLLFSLVPTLGLAFDVEVEVENDLQVEVRPPDLSPSFHLLPGQAQSLLLPGPYLEAGEEWQISLVKPPTHGQISPFLAAPPPQTEAYDAEIALTYTPNAGFLGFDQFTYRYTSARFDQEIVVPLFIVNETSPSALFVPDLSLRRGAFIAPFSCVTYTPEGNALFFATPQCSPQGLVTVADPESQWNVELAVDTQVVPSDLLSPVTYPVAVDGFDPDGAYGATARFNITVRPNRCPSPATLECVSPAPAPWSPKGQLELINTLQATHGWSHWGPHVSVLLAVGQSSDPEGDALRFLMGPTKGRSGPVIGEPGLNKVQIRAVPHESKLWVTVDDSGLAARTSMNYKVITYAQAVTRVESIVKADRTLGRRLVRFLQLLKLVKRVAADPVFSNTSYNPRIRQRKAATEKSLRYLLKITDGWVAQQPISPASRAYYMHCLGSLTAAISR